MCGPGSNTEVFLVMVMPPAIGPGYPFSPAVADISSPWSQGEKYSVTCLRAAAQVLLAHGLDRDNLKVHALNAHGGASGVAESIVDFVKQKHVDAVVMGSRGLGSLKRSFMPVMGLGSVSDYCIHNLHVPVIVVRSDARVQDKKAKGPRTVCLACDDSVYSGHALEWTLQHLLRDDDVLQIISVAAPVPYPLVGEELLSVADEEAREWQRAKEASIQGAEALAGQAGELAVQKGWRPEQVMTGCVESESYDREDGIARSIAEYAKAQKVDLLVVGARGLGAFQGSMMSFMGLGSVSDYLVHNVTTCPVAVVKADPSQLKVSHKGASQQPSAGTQTGAASGAGASSSGVKHDEHGSHEPQAKTAADSTKADIAASAHHVARPHHGQAVVLQE